MEEYIQLMADKAHKRGQMFDWETATYGKIYDDIDLFKDFEADFSALVYNDALASDPKVSSQPILIFVNDLKSDTGSDIDEINVKLPSEDISILPLDSVINVNIDTYSQKFDKTIETNHDIPVSSKVDDIFSKHVFQCLDSAFTLTVDLRVISRAHVQTSSQCLL
ncbi:hypothetical protein Tco_1457379 [Tanacetum coccineum]